MTEQVENRSCPDHCDGACCRNAVLVGVTDRERTLFFRTVQKPTTNDVLDIVFQRPAAEGVYFATDTSGVSIIGIKGNCPNLLPDGKCSVYNERPNACRNLVIGSRDCKVARKKEELGPLKNC